MRLPLVGGLHFHQEAPGFALPVFQHPRNPAWRAVQDPDEKTDVVNGFRALEGFDASEEFSVDSGCYSEVGQSQVYIFVAHDLRPHCGSLLQLQTVLTDFLHRCPEHTATNLQIVELIGTQEDKRRVRMKMRGEIENRSGKRVAESFFVESVLRKALWDRLFEEASDAESAKRIISVRNLLKIEIDTAGLLALDLSALSGSGFSAAVLAHIEEEIAAEFEESRNEWITDDRISLTAGTFIKSPAVTNNIRCRTPKGDQISLPSGATPLDFAYAVHNVIGDTCVGSKINGRMMPLRTRLADGDHVEIITSRAQTPSPTWERFLLTPKAKRAVRRFIRKRLIEQNVLRGRSMVDTSFKNEGLTLTESALEPALIAFNKENIDDLFEAVGAGTITAYQTVVAVHPEIRLRHRPAVDAQALRKRFPGNTSAQSAEPDFAVRLARCCNPLPGDTIVGLPAGPREFFVHVESCAKVKGQPERKVEIEWKEIGSGGAFYVTSLKLDVVDHSGELPDLAQLIASYEANVLELRIVGRERGRFHLKVRLEVTSLAHLHQIVAAMREQPWIKKVDLIRR